MKVIAYTALTAVLLVCGCSQDKAETAAAQKPTAVAVAKTPAQQKHSNVKMSQAEVLRKLKRAGIEVVKQEKTRLYPADLKKFPAEPRAAFSARIIQGKEETNVTFVQFDSAAQAGEIRGVNGFHVHNWFFRGTISTYWVKLFRHALR